MLTRFAPTPSGFLHEGNLVNLSLVNDVARALGAQMLLRIDDADTDRARPEYVADVFRSLTWLGVTPDRGPRTVDEVGAWSQVLRRGRYWDALMALEAAGAPVFACACSRAALAVGSCVAGCVGSVRDLDPGVHAIRLHTPEGDATLWGKHHPGYHLVSCIDDIDYGVTHVVRGADLQDATRVHRRIHELLGSPGIAYAHHELLTDGDGSKLSKSQGTARLDLTPELRERVVQRAAAMLPAVLSQFPSASAPR